MQLECAQFVRGLGYPAAAIRIADLRWTARSLYSTDAASTLSALALQPWELIRIQRELSLRGCDQRKAIAPDQRECQPVACEQSPSAGRPLERTSADGSANGAQTADTYAQSGSRVNSACTPHLFGAADGRATDPALLEVCESTAKPTVPSTVQSPERILCLHTKQSFPLGIRCVLFALWAFGIDTISCRRTLPVSTRSMVRTEPTEQPNSDSSNARLSVPAIGPPQRKKLLGSKKLCAFAKMIGLKRLVSKP